MTGRLDSACLGSGRLDACTLGRLESGRLNSAHLVSGPLDPKYSIHFLLHPFYYNLGILFR